MYQRRYGTTSGSYPDLDRFGRVIASRWTKDLATDMDFVSVSVGYDENSNPLTTEENIFDTGFDVKYAIDGLDRVTDADEGTLSGGNITSQTRRQQWTLSQTGNWDAETLDLNGAASGYGTNGRTETRTHNLVNELTARSVTTDGGGPTTKNLVYDAAGNLTDDGETYAYEYDAWHRLRKIKDRGTSAVVSEHQYYGNGFRSGERHDADADGDIDANDPWYWFALDERWRIVGTFRASDTSPKERFVHHTAGAGGYGTSSYIDQVVLRERDANTSWTAASDGTLEERLYYCQNWRHDVVALVTANGELRERVRYTSYGIPFGKPLGDCDGDGDVDAADQAILLGAWGTNTPKCDLNLDGTINATDQSTQLGNIGVTSGFAELTRNRNRIGYAGYAADSESTERWHVRHRVLESKLGRWTKRDPAGYADESSTYSYIAGRASAAGDPTGLSAVLWFEPDGTQEQLLNACSDFGCTARPVLYGISTAFGKTVVAHVVREIEATCCNSLTTSRYREGFYEVWDKVPAIAPLARIPLSTHILADDTVSACLLKDRRYVRDVRLVDSIAVDAFFDRGLAWSVTWEQICDQNVFWMTNDRVSDDDMPAPPFWNAAFPVNVNSHESDVTMWGCCDGITERGAQGKCIPGPPYPGE